MENLQTARNFVFFLQHNGWSIAQNFKVFSSLIAKQISGKDSPNRQQFHLPRETTPTTKVALLVANPVTKFYAACREDKIARDLALLIIKENTRPKSPAIPFPSFHFFPQVRFFLNHTQPVYAWRSPDHIADFWREMGFDALPAIYTKEEASVSEAEIREIYKQDFELWDEIANPKTLISPSKTLVSDFHYFCNEPKTENKIVQFGSAVTRFARSGFATTPPEILAAREATCRACPEWDAAALGGSGRCRKCGCATWPKLRMATESCPLGKWKAVPPTQNTESTENQQRQA